MFGIRDGVIESTWHMKKGLVQLVDYIEKEVHKKVDPNVLGRIKTSPKLTRRLEKM